MATAEKTARALDAALPRPALVLGSPPPGGRDLDLLLRAPELEAAAAALEAAGFLQHGSSWARFCDRQAYGVDLVPAASWRLPERELDELFAAAEPLPGFERLVRPAPRHALLVLARLGLSPKRRPRLAAELERDPLAWAAARELAPAWNLIGELERLERAWRGEGTRRPARPRVPRVVALSGLDGSGKSSQARALQQALTALGYEVEVRWLPLGQDRLVEILSGTARLALRTLGRLGALKGAKERAERGESLAAAPGAERQAGGLVHAWATVVALANASAQLRAWAGSLGHADVVIYDRHALDSIVRIRFLYGAATRFPVQQGLIRTLAPRPLRAFWLDVPAEEAFGRKPEHWDVHDLAAQRSLYADEHEALGVRRLDGTRPEDELAAEIAAEVWRGL